MKTFKFIDLFAGMGGMRLGFEQACAEQGVRAECVFSSEIKPAAIKAYKKNFPASAPCGDITQIGTEDIPDFDFLLAGFPCQPFSSAGSRNGFMDTRGTLFFEIERILRLKKPQGFLLENVEGLVTHDRRGITQTCGRTLETMLSLLVSLGYHVTYKILNAADYGVPQNRKRVYIMGHNSGTVSLNGFPQEKAQLKDILEKGLPVIQSDFTAKLLAHFSVPQLYGKSVKDKRGGEANIHSWEIGLKGEVSAEQKQLLSKLLRQRRQKKWAAAKGIDWMDGMPLTLEEIHSFHDSQTLREDLEDLVSKGYLRFEHPKALVTELSADGRKKTKRVYAKDKKKGYNIVVGKLSFEISKILNPFENAPTLVATDAMRLAVPDGTGLRRLTVREGLRLFGFPDTYDLESISYRESFDLLGNTVIVPVIAMLCRRYLSQIMSCSSFVAQQNLIQPIRPVQMIGSGIAADTLS